MTYTVVVANTGSEDVTLQSLTDSVFGDLNGQGTCATGVAIAEDDSYSCEFTWQLSSDTLTAHRNIVTATVVDDDNTPATDSDDATVTFEDVKPAISVVKTASPTVVPETGGDVTFTFRVENTGTEAVTIVSLDDSVYGPLAGDADCAVGMVLDADESCEFTITDRVQGVFGGPDHVNTFTAVAEDNEANDATASDDATVQFSDVEATISVAKSATPASATVGDEIRYDYVVTNSGLMNLMMVTLGDDLLGQVPLFTDPALTQPYVDGTLAPGESLYGVMTYMVVESDLPEPIVNVALADALSEYQEPVSAEDTASVDLTYTKGLSLVKTASVDGADVGEEILYTYTIRNTGNVTLSNLALTDDVLGTIALSVDSLAAGAQTTATATHVVVEGDLPGPLVNEATATAFTRLQEPVSAKDTATVLLGAHPALAIVKTGPESPQEMGAVLDYEIVVTNTGDVTLTNVTVTDALLGISKTFPSLAPGASQTVEGTYTVTEADIPEGFTAEDTSFDIVNVATADSDQTGPVSDDWSVTVNYEFYIPLLGLAIEKTGPAAAEVGDTILYTIVVTNTGETDLADVVVTDAKLGLMETIALLAAGEAKTFTGSYGPVTEEDLPGPIENTATASQAQVGEVQDTWTVPVGTNPGLSITKSGPASVAIGGTIPYTIVVQNTGDVTLADVRVVDSKLGLDVMIVSLAPGETKTFTPSYGPVSEGDLPGPIENTATASHPATGTVQDSWEVAIVTGPALAIAKTGPDQAVEVGDTITYRLVVTNVGDVTLHHVVVEDARLGFAETVAALAPGEAREFVLEYTVGEGDLTSELLIHNVATADADETEPVSDEHTVPIKDFEQEIEPCVRSDVAVIIYGGWNGLPVRAWAAGAEQAVQHTALNAFGEPQATWTFWPGEGETFTVTVAPELPAELDGARWSYQALSSPTVSFGRCQARTIYFQLMDNGTPSPTPVPPVPSLPQTGASGLGQEVLRAALIAVGLAWLLLAGAWLLRRRLPIAGKGR